MGDRWARSHQQLPGRDKPHMLPRLLYKQQTELLRREGTHKDPAVLGGIRAVERPPCEADMQGRGKLRGPWEP